MVIRALVVRVVMMVSGVSSLDCRRPMRFDQASYVTSFDPSLAPQNARVFRAPRVGPSVSRH